MTVQELRDALADIDGDTLVVLPSHNCGGLSSPLDCVTADMVYQAENTWSGDVGYDKFTDEQRENGATDDELLVGPRVVMLWPVS